MDSVDRVLYAVGSVWFWCCFSVDWNVVVGAPKRMRGAIVERKRGVFCGLFGCYFFLGGCLMRIICLLRWIILTSLVW